MSSAAPNMPKPSNYRGNSNLEKDIAAEEKVETPKLKKLDNVTVVTTKKSVGRRIRENLGGQDLKTVGFFILTDVIIPNARNLAFDILTEGGHRAIFGEGAGSRRGAVSSLSGVTQLVGNASSRIRQTNYNAISNQGVRSAGDTALNRQERAQFDFSNLVLETRPMAEEIVANMIDAINEYQRVSVADFYDQLQIEGTGFTDQTFGWTAKNFQNVEVRKVRAGYIINLPMPVDIT